MITKGTLKDFEWQVSNEPASFGFARWAADERVARCTIAMLSAFFFADRAGKWKIGASS